LPPPPPPPLLLLLLIVLCSLKHDVCPGPVQCEKLGCCSWRSKPSEPLVDRLLLVHVGRYQSCSSCTSSTTPASIHVDQPASLPASQPRVDGPASWLSNSGRRRRRRRDD